jgi:hypothetical protein
MARELPDIERIEVLESEEQDGVMRRRVRYTPSRAAEKIPALARGRLTPEMMVWVEESRFYRREHRLEYTVHPNLPDDWREQFTSRGEFTFADVPGAGECRVARKIAGEVIVRVPVVGGMVERQLVKGLRASFRAEAAILAAWLVERRAR